MSPRDLPIWQLHFEILNSLRSGHHLVVVAATGSGKTTQVPQMLLDGGLAGDKRIVILQPRRVAARSVAARVAWERGQKVGQEVGFQVRFDDRLGPDSRICFVTEGILLRWLQDDPQLSDVGILILDEFHERNLLSDVSLALAKRLQQTSRPDLKLVVMSATLEAEPVAQYLTAPISGEGTAAAAPILSSEGRAFPVDIKWAEYGDQRPASEQAASAVERLVNSGAEGDILVFMPGMSEILATIRALESAQLKERCVYLPLHGDLPPEDQDRAFAQFDARKIVVATNVAETSITIDGIRHVVDSGLARVARYDAERGIQTLAAEPISRASADQRAGRAGRTAPGVCWRLWTESGHLDRPAKNTPEIQRADLAEVVLRLHSLGIRRAATFDWLDRPDAAAVERAEKLLRTLGALQAAAEDSAGPRENDLTPVGRQMLRLPMHPRYSRMLVEASRRGCVPAAALCAALTSGRELLVKLGKEDGRVKEARELFEASPDSDFYTLMRAFQFAKNSGFDVGRCRQYGIHAQTARLIEDTYRQLLDIARREKLIEEAAPEAAEPAAVASAPTEAGGRNTKAKTPEPLLIALTAGFIDQLAVRKDSGTLDCRLAEGRTATLARESLVESPLLVAGEIREVDGRNGRLTLLALATSVRPEWLRELYPQHLSEHSVCTVDRLHKRVAVIRETRFLDLVIAKESAGLPEPAASGQALADAFAAGWFDLPKLNHQLRQFIARVNLLARIAPELEIPAFDGAALRRTLATAFHGLTLMKEAQAADLSPAFQAHLDSGQHSFLDEFLPLTWKHPNGQSYKLVYSDQSEAEDGEIRGPEVQIKLSDTFVVSQHPRLAEGRLPITLILLAPDQKRLGATTDLPTWRAKTYPGLRSQIRQKYPGFAWP